MKKVLIALFVIICVFAVGYNAYQSEKQATTGKTKVYAVLPLSGVMAQYGKDAKVVVDWYIENKKPDFEVVYIDSESEPAKGLTAFQQKAIYAEKPIVFSLFAPVSSVLLPVIKEKNGFLFSVAAVSLLTDLDNFQIVSHSLPDMVDTLGPYIQKNFKNIAIFYSDDVYGIEVVRLMEKAFTGKIKKESYQQKNPDVRIEVLKLLEENPEAILITGTPTPAYINIFKELKTHGYKGAILADTGFTNPHVFKQIGDFTEGVIASAMSVETPIPQSEEVEKLKAEFKKTDKIFYFIMTETLESFEVINYTLKNNLPFSQKTYQNIGTWKGISGDISFLPKGDCSFKSYVLIQVKNGQIVPLEESKKE